MAFLRTCTLSTYWPDVDNGVTGSFSDFSVTILKIAFPAAVASAVAMWHLANR